MQHDIPIERLVDQVTAVASSHAGSVARGAETPRLAAYLERQYGRGVTDALAVIQDNPRAADPISSVVLEASSKIDPQWQKLARERLAGGLADITIR